MSDIALTTIIHGNDDGSVTRIEYGEPVSGLPAVVIKQLKDDGVIGDEPMANSEAMAQIEALKSQLAEAQARLNQQSENQKTDSADSAPVEPATVEHQDKAPIKK